jgi:hypothetical protein
MLLCFNTRTYSSSLGDSFQFQSSQYLSASHAQQVVVQLAEQPQLAACATIAQGSEPHAVATHRSPYDEADRLEIVAGASGPGYPVMAEEQRAD